MSKEVQIGVELLYLQRIDVKNALLKNMESVTSISVQVKIMRKILWPPPFEDSVRS